MSLKLLPHDRVSRGAGRAPRRSRLLAALFAGMSLGSLSTAPVALAGPALLAVQSSTSLTSRLDHEMSRVGSQSGAYVVDLDTGTPLYASRADAPRNPASVEKLYTLSTALLRFGPTGQLFTRVLGAGALQPNGVFRGNLYLRGGGDPTFGSAAFIARAYGAGATVTRLARTLIVHNKLASVRGRILGDESIFDSRRGGPRTGFRLDTDIEGDLSGLAFDRGARQERGTASAPDPASFAAARLAATLRDAHVGVSGRTGIGHAPATATELARVASPPMSTLAKLTLGSSDNFFAEMLLKDLGAYFGGGGTTPAGAAVVRAQVASLGIHPQIVDGSGLSRADYTSPRELVSLLARVPGLPIADALTAALPVAGRSGTLIHRMRGTIAQGACRAKTGTLNFVSALAGYCHAADGHTLAFAFLMNSVDVATAHSAQDHMAIALAGYGG